MNTNTKNHKTVVIAGATGLVGSNLVGKLLADNDVEQVISISRRSLGIESPKLKEIMVPDLAELERHRAELRGDVYFCCLGTTIRAAGSRENFRRVDFDAIVEFGKIAKSHNGRFVVISSAGANPRSPVFYSRTKGEMEGAIRHLGLRSLVIFRPGLLIGERKEFRLGEKIAIVTFRALSPFLPRSITKRMATDVDLLAERMLAEGKGSSTGVRVIEAREI